MARAPDKTVLLDMTPLSTESRVRGHGRYIRDLARGLARLSDDERGGLRILGLTDLRLDGSHEVTSDLPSFEGNPEPRHHQLWAMQRRLGLRRACRAIGADVVHLADPDAVPFFFGPNDAKRIATAHDLNPTRYPEKYDAIEYGRWFGNAREHRRYRSADHVVCISRATLEDLVSFARVPREKATMVYNGVDLERWRRPHDPARLAAMRLEHRPFVLYVGDAAWNKNTEGMMRGLARARAHGHDVALVWAGRLSDARVRTVDEAAAAAGVTGAVHRLGFVDDDDLLALFRGAVAHLFVSLCEGFGLTVVESMAASCPVITSHAGALAEVAGDAALVVDPNDAQAIGDAIAKLTVKGDERARLIAAGEVRASMFSNDAQARGMAAVYRRVLGL